MIDDLADNGTMVPWLLRETAFIGIYFLSLAGAGSNGEVAQLISILRDVEWRSAA